MGDPKRCHAPPASHGQVEAATQKKIKLFEIELADESGKVMSNVEYKITFEGGTVRTGKTDQKGTGSHSDVPDKEMHEDFELRLKDPGAERKPPKAPEIKPDVAKIIRCQNAVFTIENLPQNSRIRNWVFYCGTETEKIEVKRQKGEKPDTWQKSWEGQIVTAGTILVHHEIRERVCDSDAKVIWRITPYAPVKYKVDVVPRTHGWSSTVTRLDEKPTSKIPNNILQPGATLPKVPPTRFPDLGIQIPSVARSWSMGDPKTVPGGPNKGYSFLDIFTVSNIDSYAFINDHLLQSGSVFARAQDGNVYVEFEDVPGRKLVNKSDVKIQGGKATPNNEDDFKNKYKIPVWLVEPGPKRRLKDGEYTISGGQATLTDEAQFRKSYKIPDSVNQYQLYVAGYKMMYIILYADLLRFTRRHEYAGDPHSHRANFEKVIRALDPKAYVESLIAKPGENAKEYFRTKFEERLKEIASLEAGDNLHKMVDEKETKKAQAIKYLPQKMFGLNVDDAGVDAGDVWDPKNKKSFEGSGY